MLLEDQQRVLYAMTNLYRDRLPIDSAWMKMANIYASTIGLLETEFQRVEDGSSVFTSPLLRTIPYFKLDAASASYSVSLAAELQKNPIPKQIERLDALGYYTILEYRPANSSAGVVYDLTLKLSFKASFSLEPNIDFILKGNKIFLLPSFIIKHGKPIKTLHAFDIVLNDYFLERSYGTYYQVELGTLIPRNEYRDVLYGFDRAMSSDLTIRELKKAIKQVTKWKEFNLQDYYTPSLSVGKKRLYEQWVISPLTFIVSIPEYIIYDKVRIHILEHLLDQTKQSQTNYVTFFQIDRTDEAPYLEDETVPTIDIEQEELSPAHDQHEPKINLNFTELIFSQGAFDNYDDQIIYDGTYNWDTGVFISYDDTQEFDADRFDQTMIMPNDYVNLYVVSFPEIPRNVSGVRDNNEVMITLRPNTDGTTDFEVYHSSEETGEYSFVTSVSNTGSGTEIEIIFNESSNDNYYYKVRAISGNRTSMWTLPIYI